MMSRRRGLRSHTQPTQKAFSESDNDMDEIDLLRGIAILESQHVERTSRKRSTGSPAASTSNRNKSSRNRGAGRGGSKPSKSEKADNDSSVICLDLPEGVGDFQEEVQDRIKKYFRTSMHIISDDEEEVVPVIEKPTNSRFSRDYYVLSDSDDDSMPSSSGISKPNSATVISPAPTLVTTPVDTVNTQRSTIENQVQDSTRDEILELVDNILNSSESMTNLPKNNSDVDYRAKTQELLRDTDGLLDDLKKQTTAGSAVELEDLTMPPCPVCLEVLGRDVPAATTHCGHMFCRPCITQVAKATKKCPVCRKGVTLKKIIPLHI